MERLDGALGRHFDEKDERTLLQNAKCKMQRSESRASSHTRTLCRATHALERSSNAKTGGRTEREKRVLSPLGLTFRENRVLKPLWASFFPGVVICAAEGANGDSKAILWRFRGCPSLLYPAQQSISIRNAIKTTGRILSVYYRKDTNALQCYGVTVQIRLYHTSKNNSISIYRYRDILHPPGNYFWNCNTVTL